MVTIYFDKHVFSHLFKAKDEKYAELREKILSHKDDFLFFYSNAHLLDLQQDTTDIKFAEMEFMQQVVEGNHLIYQAPNIVTKTEAPRSAFDNIASEDDFSWLESLDYSKISEEDLSFINNIVDLAAKDFAGELDVDWLKTRTPVFSKEPLVDKTTVVSLAKFASHHFYEEKESYKTMRDKSIAMYNPEMITSDEEIVFNNQLSSSPLGLPFVEAIKAVFNQVGLQTYDNARVYDIAYMMLDMLGINKEARKKVKLRNMQTDGMHSFFGSFCDCIVSDDAGIRQKSKTLYKLFNIETKVYSIDEFIEKFDYAIRDNQKSASEYLAEIRSDYEARQVLRTDSLSPYILTDLAVSHKYFGYFNYMLERKSGDETVIMLCKNYYINQPVLIHEVEILTNRIVRVYNELGASFELFNKEKELPLINEDNWHRVLITDGADLCLTKYPKAPVLCFWIKPREGWA